MKRFLLLAAAVGGLTLAGFASTAKADHFMGGGWGGGYGRGYGCGWHGGCGPRYGYGYRPVVSPGLFIGGPRFSFGIGTGYAYPSYPAYGQGCGYPGYYGW
ncbi:MAG: hypothetical protein ACM3U2_09250 [Deltaproteobacteria bacterium]